MDLGVGGVLELLRDEHARVGGGHLFSHLNRRVHAAAAGGEDQFRAVGAQQHAPLFAHRVGHDQRAFITPRRAGKRQGDARIAAGGLDDDRVGLDLAGLFSRVDHGYADAVFDRVGRVVVFQLGGYGGFGAGLGGDAVQAHQRGVADQFGRVVVNSHGTDLL